jgi:carboxypeptidase C (cathepsin A)
LTRHVGFQEIDWYRPRGTSGMHYQLFSSMGSNLNDSTPTIPLIIWLNGGPGSSSLFGAFTENGPIRISNGTAKLFQHAWTLLGHMLFIDQPLNVGFSYSGNRNDSKQVSSANEGATHLVNFLYNFYREWPKLAASPLYITGESLAGHYIPAFAREIILNETFQAATKVNLKGVAIGDGWVDPINQFNFYDSLLYSVGIVSNKFRDVCTWTQTQGMMSIYKGELTNVTLPPRRPPLTGTSSPTTGRSGTSTWAA